MKRILVWIGTRPEAIKLCPLILELTRQGIDTRVMLTGQHRDMVYPVLSFFGVAASGDLGVMRPGQTVHQLTERLLHDMAEELERKPSPAAVMVHGDTTSALCGALTAFYAGIPVIHIEAGLRSDDIYAPFPEEFNRRAIDAMSDVYFAPTELAKSRLLAEGYGKERIFVVGNTATDAVRLCLERPINHPLLDLADRRRLILLTCHRRELPSNKRLALFRAVRDIIEGREDVALVFPVHPSPAVCEAAHSIFDGCEHAALTAPLPLPLMQHLMARAYLILTDSGGVQEEAAYLGVPTLVLREGTERPEGVSRGTLRAVGTEALQVGSALQELLIDPRRRDAMACPSYVFGDGYAARRIAEALHQWEGIADI